MARKQVVVIGGGVIGAATAYFLRKGGADVVLIDKGRFASGCSHANCGFVSPSHALPLTTPGAFSVAFKSMFKKDSPFRVKPRLNWDLMWWLARFAKRCNERDMLRAGHAIHALLQSSRALYDDWMRTEQLACDWQPRGMIFVLQSEAGMKHFAETDALVREHFGVGAERIDSTALAEMEPALKPGLAGGWIYRNDAHLRPDRLMTELRRVLERDGVAIREFEPLEELVTDGRQVQGVKTHQGTLEADAVVVATGAWTPLLNQQLGCKVPIQPGKGYSITMSRPANCPTYPLIFEEHRVAITPFSDGFRIGSTMEFAGYDETLNPIRLNMLREGAKHYLHDPLGEVVEEEWYGWRPMTPDSVPILDKSPRFDNVWLAVGHNMLGLSMAPATGKVMAEAVLGEKPHLDLAPYALSRFV